jgi:hypothetical protein
MGKKSVVKNGASGQRGKDGTNTSNGADGQNAISMTNHQLGNSVGGLIDSLKSVPGGNSIEMVHDNDKLQITLNGVTIVDINKSEIVEKLQNEEPQNG